MASPNTKLIIIMVLTVGASQAGQLKVNTSLPVHTVDSKYISANIDVGLVSPSVSSKRWETLDFRNPRITTLLRGLSPCFLRFGGSNADHTVFSTSRAAVLINLGPNPLYTIYPWDIEALINWTRKSGARLLYDLNINLRYGFNWDPTNTLSILEYLMEKGYGDNIDFELGNEPDAGELHLLGKQLGKDYITLLKLLRKFPNIAQSAVVGPDIVTMGGLSRLMPDFLKAVGGNITATTFHQYYFSGLGAHAKDYINPKVFDTLRSNIMNVKNLIKAHSPNKKLPMWIGETADAWHSGTENVTDRYISGFLWMDKLGLAAQLGVSVVMRQTFYGGYYQLVSDNLYPNPDYWLTYAHKTLVGQQAFSTSVQDESSGNSLYWREPNSTAQETSMVRLYAHCTKASSRYNPGALTVFGLNLKNDSEVITFDPKLAMQTVDLYLLTPVRPDGLLSQNVALNGKRLSMVSDYQLPELIPVTVPAASGVKLSGLTFGFWVFPDADIQVCK